MFKLSKLVDNLDYKNKIVIMKSKSNCYNLYLYNDSFYCYIKLNNDSIFCNPISSSIFLNRFVGVIEFINKDTVKTIYDFSYDKLGLILFSWNSYFFKKFVIDGKAYRINKYKKGNFKLLFGRSHRTLFICKNVFLRKKKKIKKKFMFYCSSYAILNHAANVTYRVRPNDLYTARGIRSTKQISKRKLGKKGATSVI